MLKLLALLPLIALYFILPSCQSAGTYVVDRAVLADRDTLVLQMTKVKGYGPFSTGSAYLPIRDSAEIKELGWFDIPSKIPEGISDVKFGPYALWMDHPRYFAHDSTHVHDGSLGDTNTMIVMVGSFQEQPVFVVDANHNQDLTDDRYHRLDTFDWKGKNNLILCRYEIPGHSGFGEDSSWANLGSWGSGILMNTAQHFTTPLQLPGGDFELAVRDRNSMSFVTLTPQMAVIQENEVRRDTLFTRDLVEIGESVKIGDQYYRFEDFYSGSNTLVLVRDSTFAQRVGVQPGMQAPEFTFLTLTGDTLSSSAFPGKDVLVANVSGCASRSFDEYHDLLEKKSDDLVVICLNSGSKAPLQGLVVDVEDSYNEQMYDLFRNAYSSYISYLITDEGLIQDKFKIFDWQENLLSHGGLD